MAKKKINPSKLMAVRDNIDRYLKRLDADKYSKASLDRLINLAEDTGSVNKDLRKFLQELRGGIEQNAKLNSTGLLETAKAIDQLSKTITSMTSNKEVVVTLNRLEKVLSKKTKGTDVKDRTDEVIKAIKGIKLESTDIEFPKSIDVSNFPPQKIPQPVTNININPLRGLVHTSTTTVGTTLSTLPGYGELNNRRSLIFQNASSTVDIYIGGSNVTTSNGYLLEAGSVSPAFDSGPRQKWYGVTASGSADVRTVEISNDTGA